MHTYSFREINGHQLRTRVAGEGPLVVFGHGLMGNIEQIDENAPSLGALLSQMRLLTYDARGHGKSNGPEAVEGYTWETLGQDMATLVEEHEGVPAIVGGASMGAATALWVAIERPEIVRALVLMMPPPLGNLPMRQDAEKQAIQVLELLSAAVQNYGVEKTGELARMLPGFAPTPEEADQRAQWLLRQNPLTLAYAIRGLISAPFHDPECYRQISVPTLVLAHEGDGLHPARAARLLGDTIPDCEVHIGAEPEYWQNHPAELQAHFEQFFERLEV
jgi:pimeloyl-ACP methyl ester carboxylesterase